MAIERNNSEQKFIDKELFEELKEGLLQVFRNGIKREAKYGDKSHEHIHGLAAANAGQALIDLHANFKPRT